MNSGDRVRRNPNIEDIHALGRVVSDMRKPLPARRFMKARLTSQTRKAAENTDMLAKRIIPCLDVDNGRGQGVRFVDIRCQRPVGSLSVTTGGADELTFLDITASAIAERWYMWSSGSRARCSFRSRWRRHRTLDDIRRMLNAGADKVSINTAAVARQIHARGGGTLRLIVVVALDAKQVSKSQTMGDFTHGGRKPTGLDAVEWARRMVAFERAKFLDQYGPGRHQTRLRS